MRIDLFIVSLSLCMSAAVAVQADTLTGNGSLQSWNSTILGTGSGPYWNTNNSGDGPNSNIGWCLTGTGNCSIANPPGTPSYYGNGTAAPSTIGFANGGTPQLATLAGIFTNQLGNGPGPNGTDHFGWYSVSGGNVVTHELFDSSDPLGTTAIFAPTASYGFYLENVQTAGVSPDEADYFWFMNDSLDFASKLGTIDPGVQHFSVFSGTNGYYFGIEDTPAANSDFDYNDMIVAVQPVPEPTSNAMIAGGIGMLGWSVLRRRR